MALKSDAFIDIVSDDLSDLTSCWSLWEGESSPEHSTLVRKLDDDRYVAVMPLLFTWAVVWGHLPPTGAYVDRWCYSSLTGAIAAASVWDGTGEPEGWHRHPFTGRRRPDGDPTKEYVAR